MKKLVVIKYSGNHSNRLLQNLHFEAFCKEYNITFKNPTFNDLSLYYEAPCNSETNLFFRFLQIDILGKLFHHSSLTKKVFSIVWILSKLTPLKYIRFDKENDIIDSQDILLQAFEKNEVVYVAGWRFRVPQLCEKYRADLVREYSLKSSFYKGCDLEKKIHELKISGFTLIGIHIRRGDYKKWKKGAYYYNDDVYEKYMRSISEQLTNSGTTKQIFVLFSNETPNIQESENVILSKEKWFVDQHIMSMCDYLIGPPSTFTLWASYLGKTKLFHIYDCNAPLIIERL